MATEEGLNQRLQDLQKQLGKRQTFEEAVSSIKSLLKESYSSSSPSTRKLFYSVICRVATVLRTRYTAPGYLRSGLDLFKEAECRFSDPAEKNHIKSCITSIRGELHEPEEEQNHSNGARERARGGYLFEGHLTVDPEPPQPNWLVQQSLLTALASQPESSTTIETLMNSENMGSLFQGLVDSLEDAVTASLDDGVAIRSAAPPASKAVLAALPVIKVDEGVLEKVGEEAECAICKEKLGVGDEMQEVPCKHLFHPPCLKPWMEEHNSCPICRYELPTDDHKYESWKEREKELEEERRGAANAVRGGEFMYV